MSVVSESSSLIYADADPERLIGALRMEREQAEREILGLLQRLIDAQGERGAALRELAELRGARDIGEIIAKLGAISAENDTLRAELSYSAGKAEEFEYLLAQAKGERDEERRRGDTLASLVDSLKEKIVRVSCHRDELIERCGRRADEAAELADSINRQLAESLNEGNALRGQLDSLREDRESIANVLERVCFEKELLHAHIERELIKALSK